MLSIELAIQLRTAGLVWEPQLGDAFHIPDRNLDDRHFIISDLSTEVTEFVDGIGAITFNGSVEWSLDYILSQEVVWMPSETQLRSRLGPAFIHLDRATQGFHCILVIEGEHQTTSAETAEDAYGLALLRLLDPR